MSIVLDKPGFVPMPSLLDDMDNQFPDQLFITYHRLSERHGCYCASGIHGVAAFSTHENAAKLSGLIGLDGMEIQQVSLEEALDIAKSKDLPVVCVHLLDDFTNPKTIYVK